MIRGIVRVLSGRVIVESTRSMRVHSDPFGEVYGRSRQDTQRMNAQITPMMNIGNICRLSKEVLTVMPILSTCTLHTYQNNSGCGKERRILIGFMVTCQGTTRYWNYPEVYWPCASGLSAVNAIGMQLHDPINSGLTRWRMAV